MYVRENGGTVELVLIETSNTSTIFRGSLNKRYF